MEHKKEPQGENKAKISRGVAGTASLDEYVYKGRPSEVEDPWIYPMPSEKERDRRWQAIRTSMQKCDVDCLIVTEPFVFTTLLNYLYYITNYQSYANIGSYLLFPLKGEPQIVFSSGIGPQFLHCASKFSWIKELVNSDNPIQDIVKKIKQLNLEEGKLGIVGYYMGVFPAVVYDGLRESLPVAAFEDATGVLGEAMNEVSRTSEEEFAFVKKTCEINDLAFKAVAEALKPGVRELDLWAAAEQAFLKNGCWYPHFMIGTSGPSPTLSRNPASHNILKKGDVILFEINAVYAGISSQIALALSISRPKKEVEEMFGFCLDLYQWTLKELEKNQTYGDTERALVQRIRGVGYEPMTPQIHIYNSSQAMPTNIPPQPGDYFIVHPNLCKKDYSAGAKFGDTVYITRERKVGRLNKTPAQLHII